MDASVPVAFRGDELVLVVIDRSLNLVIRFDHWLLWLLIVLVVAFFLLKLFGRRLTIGRRFEIDQAQFGIGQSKITLKPNETDRQIAYKIWVELSTRKIGLPIDLDDDVIIEIYDSWYNFFSVTRELIKDVPVSRFRRKDTEKIIRLSIEVLNSGLRPHLTKWQARFRRWYDRRLAQDASADLHPQDVQKQFPDYEVLRVDLLAVNERLIRYREKMYELVTNL